MNPLPDNRTVQAALRTTTRRLAAELLAPQDQAPGWSDFEWRTAMAVCAMQGISVLLARRLRWSGPEVWQAYLAQQQEQGRLRDQRIGALLERLHHEARQAGLPMLGLKGSALRPLGLYAPGERPMADVDLLVRPADAERAGALVAALGYQAGPEHWRHRVYKPASAGPTVHLGEHAENPIRIELHTHVTERMALESVELTPSLWPAEVVPGLLPYASPAALMRHLLLHVAGNIAAQSVRLVQLADIARLSAGWTAETWQQVLADTGEGPPWWALPPLKLAMRHQPLALPPALLRPLERACRWPLRRAASQRAVEDVSFANARVLAFPGIEWSRSPAQALRLVQARLVPGRETKQWRRFGVDDHPATRFTPWASSSQTQRVLRWLTARPLRAHSVHAVQLALDYGAR